MKQGVSKMKNVFFSILVLFMLAFSMLGNVNLVKAGSNNIVVSDINPITAIKGVDNSVQISFNVRNIDLLNELVVDITSTDPETSDHLNLLNIQDNLIEDNINLVHGDQASQITFSVPISLDVIVGTYTATVKVQDTVNVDNFVEKTYTIIVQDSNPSVSITGLTDEELIFTGEEESTPENRFTIRNNGNRDLVDLRLVFPNEEEFVDPDSKEIIFRIKIGDGDLGIVDLAQPVNLGALNIGGELIVLIRSDIQKDIELNTYKGEVLIKSLQFGDLSTGLSDDSFSLVIKVEPEVCNVGRVSDKNPVNHEGEGNIRITDLDVEEDTLNVGEDIQITVDVENKDSNKMDVVVEAMLYNLDQNKRIIGWEEIGAETIEEGSEESFDYILKIPVNDEDIDPEDIYILYVKAYEDGKEKDNCNYYSIEIDIDREDDSVIVNEFTMTPNVVSLGEKILFSVGVLNIGNDKQDDVYITLTNPELKLNLKSTIFELDKYSKSSNDLSRTFEFTVPKDAEAKDYTIEARVDFRDGKDSHYTTATLTVQGEAVTPPGEQPPVVVNPPVTGPGTYTTGRSVFDSFDTKTLFIVGDIVLVILAVLFLILIFRRR